MPGSGFMNGEARILICAVTTAIKSSRSSRPPHLTYMETDKQRLKLKTRRNTWMEAETQAKKNDWKKLANFLLVCSSCAEKLTTFSSLLLLAGKFMPSGLTGMFAVDVDPQTASLWDRKSSFLSIRISFDSNQNNTVTRMDGCVKTTLTTTLTGRTQ